MKFKELRVTIEEKHEGFAKVQKSIEAEGKSPKAAAAIAASIGRKKYGKKSFDKHAAEGIPEGVIDEAADTKRGWILKRGQPSMINKKVKSATIVYHRGKAVGEAHEGIEFAGYEAHHYKSGDSIHMEDSMNDAIDRVKEFHHDHNKSVTEGVVGEIKPSEKGSLHTALGVKQDKKIPAGKIAKAEHSSDPALKKKAVFAANAKKWNHESFEDFVKPLNEFEGNMTLMPMMHANHKEAMVHHQMAAIRAHLHGQETTAMNHETEARHHAMWEYHDNNPTTARPPFERPSLQKGWQAEEVDSDNLEGLEEGANYHSVFVQHEGEWQHHADFDNLEDAREEKDYLKRKGDKAYHAVVPKSEANWEKPGAAHKYMTKKLGAVTPTKETKTTKKPKKVAGRKDTY
jgi:hypothetical protein